jgi:hypothetical protein
MMSLNWSLANFAHIRIANQSKYVRTISAEFKWGVQNIQQVIQME